MMARMHRLRFIFGLLIVEIIVVAIIGVMALDNNTCDVINGWYWSYQASPTPTIPSCSTINTSVASSEGRFDSLLIAVATIPPTALWGYLTARAYERRDNHLKATRLHHPKEDRES
jgi:hypothetical protein